MSHQVPEYPELSAEQLTELKTIWEAGNCTFTFDCDDADYVVRQIIIVNFWRPENLQFIFFVFPFLKKFEVCSFLNETVSHEDQAEKLGIAIVLYQKLVAVRKLYSDKNDESRLALAVSIRL